MNFLLFRAGSLGDRRAARTDMAEVIGRCSGI